MALSGHIGEPWHTWTPEKREMSLSSSSNCLGQEHIGRSEDLPRSTRETSAKYIPRNLSGVRRGKLSVTTPTDGTMYLCCLARHVAYMVQISRSHMSSHVTFKNHYAATQSPARLQTERHRTCQQFQSIVFSIYLCDVCQCYILTCGVGVHICH